MVDFYNHYFLSMYQALCQTFYIIFIKTTHCHRMRGSEKQSNSLKATQLLRVGSRIQIGVSLAVNISLFSCFFFLILTLLLQFYLINLYFFFLKLIYLYIFIFGCVGSLFLCKGFLQLRQAGATLHRGAWASHCCGLFRCGAQAPDAQAQQVWLTGLAAPRHVGSSWTGARTRVPCIGRRIPNHCATREALFSCFYYKVKKNKIT